MKKFKYVIVALMYTALPVLCTAQVNAEPSQSTKASRAQTLKSPNGDFEMQFDLSQEGTPQYQLTFNGKTVIAQSTLGFDLKNDEKSLKNDFEVIEIDNSTFDETWEPVWGEETTIRNHYNEMLVALNQNGTNRQMNLRFRLFDDGLGFRYEFPQQEFSYFVIGEELTQFAMNGDHTAFWIAGDFDTQEYNYTTSKLSEIKELHATSISGNACIYPLSPFLSGVKND